MIATYRLRFKDYYGEGEDLIIDEDKGLSSDDLTIVDACYNDGKLIGTAMAKEVEFQIVNTNQYDLADKEFELEVGVVISSEDDSDEEEEEIELDDIEIEPIDDSGNYDTDEDEEYDPSDEVDPIDDEAIVEYIPYGSYTVKTYEDTKSNNKYKVIAYDFMDKLNDEYIDNNEYPITLKEFYANFANFYGLEVEEQTLVNEDFEIQAQPRI